MTLLVNRLTLIYFALFVHIVATVELIHYSADNFSPSYPLVCQLILDYIILKRSHKEKRSSYAPEHGVRYDGVYRIEKCWRKIGVQVFLYLVHRLHMLLSTLHIFLNGD